MTIHHRFIVAGISIIFINSAEAKRPRASDGDLALSFRSAGMATSIGLSTGEGVTYRPAPVGTLNLADIHTIMAAYFGANWFDAGNAVDGLVDKAEDSASVVGKTFSDSIGGTRDSGGTSLGSKALESSLNDAGVCSGFADYFSEEARYARTHSIAEERSLFSSHLPGVLRVLSGVLSGSASLNRPSAFGLVNFAPIGVPNATGASSPVEVAKAPDGVAKDFTAVAYEPTFATTSGSTFLAPAPVPEPGTLALLGLGGLGFARRWRRRAEAGDGVR